MANATDLSVGWRCPPLPSARVCGVCGVVYSAYFVHVCPRPTSSTARAVDEAPLPPAVGHRGEELALGTNNRRVEK